MLDESSQEFIRSQEAIHEKRLCYEELLKLDTKELRAWSDKDLAAWQAGYPSVSPQQFLAEHEWQRRLSERQIAAAHATARRAAIWGAVSGIIGALSGVLLAWVLSGKQPPLLRQRSSTPVQAQGHTASQLPIKQPVTTPLQTSAPASPAPVQKPTNPHP